MSERETIDTPLMTVDPEHFRNVLGHFSTGVVVISSFVDQPVGMTAQSVVSLSIEPPLVLFCPAKTSKTWPLIKQSGTFCINILAADQHALGRTFAQSGNDKFANVEWRAGVTGSPIIVGALAHIECSLEAVHDGGDHDIAVGSVVALDLERTAKPLLFFRGDFVAE